MFSSDSATLAVIEFYKIQYQLYLTLKKNGEQEWRKRREIKKRRGKQREREREKKEKEKENNKDFCSQRLPRRVNNHKNNNYDV